MKFWPEVGYHAQLCTDILLLGRDILWNEQNALISNRADYLPPGKGFSPSGHVIEEPPQGGIFPRSQGARLPWNLQAPMKSTGSHEMLAEIHAFLSQIWLESVFCKMMQKVPAKPMLFCSKKTFSCVIGRRKNFLLGRVILFSCKNNVTNEYFLRKRCLATGRNLLPQ